MATIMGTHTAFSGDQHLRPLNPQRDMADVADLVELCFADSLDQDGRRYLQDMRVAARTPGYLWLASAAEQWSSVPLTGYVWVEGGKIVGNLSLVPYRIQGKRHYLIANVAVHPDYRCKGIGQALTRQGLEYARESGAPSTWLQVREGNSTAVRLYEKLGFQERARRTTWHSSHVYTSHVLKENIRIGARHAGLWGIQKGWLDQTYPEELRWNLPLKPDLLQPGIRGIFARLFHAVSVQQWVAWRGNELIGILTCQSSVGFNNLFWLSVNPNYEELAVQVLLQHARKVLGNHRSLVIDYPAHRASAAIESAGFFVRQTLIWMQIVF